VSPISREREYERRRYEKWQARLADKRRRQQRQRQRLLIAGSAAAVLLVVGGTLFWLGRDDSSPATAALTPSASASVSPAATSPGASSPAVSPSASAGPNPCPAVSVKPPATPQSFSTAPDAALAQGRSWKLTLTTTCGAIVVDLDGAKAPKAVANTIFLSGKKFWDGSPCHRLSTGGSLQMLQCGDPTGTGRGNPGYGFGPIENAPASGTYARGVLAMANTGQPNSQGSQFFLVFGDSTLPPNYTVFGHITSGLDVLDKVAAGGVAQAGSDGSGPPSRSISIVSTSVTPA